MKRRYPLKGRGDVYDGAKLLSFCSYDMEIIEEMIDTGTEPDRYIPGLKEVIGKIYCELPVPLGRPLLLHDTEIKIKMPFIFTVLKGSVEAVGAITSE